MKISFPFLLCLLVMTWASARAQLPYALDPTFGNAGIFANSTNTREGVPFQSCAQPDGKILVASAWMHALTGYADSAMVTRLKTNGTLDSAFGVGGFAVVPLPGTNGVANDVTVMPGGQIAVLAQSIVNNRLGVFVAMLSATGQPVFTFNGGAALLISDTTQDAQAYDFAIQSTGKIIVGVTTYGGGNSYNANTTATFKRINTNGTVDSTFGNGGSYVLPSSVTNLMMVDAGDHIYADYANATQTGNVEKAVYRFTESGLPDPAWGTAGKSDTFVENTSNNNAWAVALVMTADGAVRTFSFGGGSGTTRNFTTRKFTSGGQKDASYGVGGRASFDVSSFNRTTNFPAVANGNKLLCMVDMGTPGISTSRDYALVQIREDGARDSSFGNAGILRVTVGGGNAVWLNKMPDNTLIGTAFLDETQGMVMRFRQTPTGIAHINNALPATVFPNPATTQVTLRCEAGTLYALYDVAGREVLRGKTISAETIVSLADVAPGTYTLICSDGKRNAELTVIRQ